MASYRWHSTLYPSDQFVEACGAVVFDAASSLQKVCLLYDKVENEWVLPKGRRNCDESRQQAAVREVREESGYGVRLRPVTLATRAPSHSEAADVRDAPRVYDGLTEPFMLDVRQLGEAKGVKLVWWFIADLDDAAVHTEGETQFKAAFIKCDKAIEKLTFQKDRDVLKRAMELTEAPKTKAKVKLHQQQRELLGSYR
ncbi:NUDIX domain-containing protein [Xylariomycetidae sp. FL0641]|nr:NUDIX domain-containing protein [Xylariomycetidae sp. FL0641]